MLDNMVLYTPPFSGITSIYQMIDLAVEYGFKHVETLNMFELAEPDVEAAKKMRQYADEKGIDFVCTSVFINLVGEDKGNIEIAKKYADVAVVLGAPLLHHTIVNTFTDPDSVAANPEQFFNEGIEAVRAVYDYAIARGVRTVYEDQGYLFNGPKGFERFLSTVDRNVGVVADFGNIMFADERIEDFIPAVRDRIVHVHLKDYYYRDGSKRPMRKNELITRDRHYVLDSEFGQGDVDFDAAFALLKDMQYDGYYAMECAVIGPAPRASFGRSMQYAEKYIKSVKE